ncbi:TRAP transporter small permease subunit [Nitratireductor pacificus]|uniref:TRAP transporter small permease protein n=1 Tax=Nitratireductor pacificus pht-3B TaxID=391937 RepID=K2MDK7_9HYPH|nr:TRAP transporter small permease subunit [Nitratireductor pacificus]EKF18880.1 TRAP dicarboxylate transporter subunit DctQ [Nitratireductor pacificus pht-3B]
MEQLADRLDRVNQGVGAVVRWLALAMVLMQFGTVVLRYVYGISFIFLTESVLYMHAALFMLGAGFTLLVDGHVRVDIFYGLLGRRGKARIDVFGVLGFLIPSMLMIAWFSWPSVHNSWRIMEGAISVGGIPASFLLKSLIPAFCGLLIVQGLACLLRDLARLSGDETPA